MDLNTEITPLLCEEVHDRVEELDELAVTSDEYTKGVNNISKIIDRLIELKKLEVTEAGQKQDREEAKAKAEAELKYKIRQLALAEAQRFDENFVKREQLREGRKDRIFKVLIDVAGIVIPVVVAVWGTKASFRFEQEGTVTTIMGRGWINKLMPKFKH